MDKPKKIKVAVAMSGGVDSSVAAALLKKQGYDCIGIFCKFWSERKTTAENKCCSLEASSDARKVAGRLGMPFYVLNFAEPFKKNVVDKFLSDLKRGLTPNPCVYCNKFIKFDLLLKRARLLGCDYLATGHYARIGEEKIKQKNKTVTKKTLLAGVDQSKDQSYFLYNLKQDQLNHLLFPLGGLTKTKVRSLAKEFLLPVYEKSDSQEICFVPEKTHYPFLKRQLKMKPGPITDTKGKIIGQHDGLPMYTLGQRKGISLSNGPWYVIGFDRRRNRLIVGRQKDQALLKKVFKVKNLNWLAGEKPRAVKSFQVKVRYQAPAIKATIKGSQIILKQPARAIMPGQSAVFYDGDKILGGGLIS